MYRKITKQQSDILITHITENTSLYSQNPEIIKLILGNTMGPSIDCSQVQLTENQSLQLLKIIYENANADAIFKSKRMPDGKIILYNPIVEKITERRYFLLIDSQAIQLTYVIVDHTKMPDIEVFRKTIRDTMYEHYKNSEFKPIVKYLKNDWTNRIVGTLIVLVPWIVCT